MSSSSFHVVRVLEIKQTPVSLGDATIANKDVMPRSTPRFTLKTEQDREWIQASRVYLECISEAIPVSTAAAKLRAEHTRIEVARQSIIRPRPPEDEGMCHFL